MIRLLIFLFFINQAWAYQYYYYDAKKVKVSRASFRRYVRSQARSIVGEFYSILGKIIPSQNELTRIRREILRQSTEWEDWKEDCREYSTKCEDKLHAFYSRGRDLDRRILRFQKNNIKHWQEVAPKSHEEVDSLLAVSESLDRISTLNYQSLHLIEEMLITSGGPEKVNFFDEDSFKPLLRLMTLAGDNLITGLIWNPDVKLLFSTVWLNFIKKLEYYVVIGNNQDYLLHNMSDFNIAWNGFHMNVKKDQFKQPRSLLPGSIGKTVGMMHNRWNWILKLYLKNTSLIDTK